MPQPRTTCPNATQGNDLLVQVEIARGRTGDNTRGWAPTQPVWTPRAASSRSAVGDIGDQAQRRQRRVDDHSSSRSRTSTWRQLSGGPRRGPRRHDRAAGSDRCAHPTRPTSPGRSMRLPCTPPLARDLHARDDQGAERPSVLRRGWHRLDRRLGYDESKLAERRTPTRHGRTRVRS
jgi:hypothetical protein